MSSESSPEEAGQARRRFYSDSNIHDAFAEFLGITDRDQQLLARHHDALLQGSERFAQVFYDYLLSYTATAQILTRFQQEGGEIATLVESQLSHLWRMLSGRVDEDSSRHLAHIGDIHYRFEVEPVWVMGADCSTGITCGTGSRKASASPRRIARPWKTPSPAFCSGTWG